MFKNYLLFLAVVSILLETLAAKSSVFNDLDFDPIISGNQTQIKTLTFNVRHSNFGSGERL